MRILFSLTILILLRCATSRQTQPPNLKEHCNCQNTEWRSREQTPDALALLDDGKYLNYDMAFTESEPVSEIEKQIANCYEMIGTGTTYAVNGIMQSGTGMRQRFYKCKK